MPENEQSATEELGVRTANAASFLISGRFISIIISATMFIIVARLLQPHDYGIYVLIMSVAGIIGTLGNPNLGNYLKEKIPRFKQLKKGLEAGTALGDALLLSISVGALLFLLSLVLGNLIAVYFLQTTSYSFALDVGLASVLLTLVYSTLNDALISVDRSSGAAMSSIVHSSIQAFSSVALILLGFGIAGALAGFSIGLLFTSMLELYLVNKQYKIKFSINGMLKRFMGAINFSKYLTLSGIISGMLTNISTVYLGFFVLPSTIGDYGIAQKALSALDVITGSIALALIPMFSEARQRKKSGIDAEKLFHYSIYLSLLIAAPVIIFIAVFSHEIILLLFSSTYLGATLYMQLIILSVLISIFGAYGTNFVIGIGKPHKVMKYSLITGAITLAAMIVFTKYFSIIGTILAIFYVGNIVPGVLYVRYILKHGAMINVPKLLRVMIANLAVVAVLAALLMASLEPILNLVIGAVLYFAIYPILAAKLGAIESKDVELIRKSGSRLPMIGGILNALLNYASMFLG